MAKAWIYQDDKQLKKHGPKKASWYCGWYEGRRKRCKSFGPGSSGKQLAYRYSEKIEKDLTLGERPTQSTKWPDFLREYTETVLKGPNKPIALKSIRIFERIVKPTSVPQLTTHTFDRFVSIRRKEEVGNSKTISPATVNRDLRNLKAMMRVAFEWKLISEVPRFRFLDEPEKIPRFVSEEHFGQMFEKADVMESPTLPGITAPQWWRALITSCYLTGWRISEVLGVRLEDLDFETKILVGRYQSSKRKRDEMIRVNDFLLDVLRPIWCNPKPMLWVLSDRELYRLFDKLQTAAGISLICREEHEHTERCQHYGFHDFRRAFATNNALTLSADQLQKLMKHKSYSTTQRYVNMAEKMRAAEAAIFIPSVFRNGGIVEGRPENCRHHENN